MSFNTVIIYNINFFSQSGLVIRLNYNNTFQTPLETLLVYLVCYVIDENVFETNTLITFSLNTCL